MFAQSLPLILTLLAIGAGIFFNNKGLADLRSDLRSDMKDLRSELKADIAASRVEFKADLAKLESRMDARFDAVDARFDAVDVRFNAIDVRFTGIDVRFNTVDLRLNSIDSSLFQFSELKGHLEGRVDEIAKRVAA